MQTAFTAEQLADPDVRAADAILRRCVHCGFCNATCPTYTLTGDELDGPRGRIYLLKDLLEGAQPPTPKTVSHIDRCLSCLSCMTTCPSGVNYMHLVDHGRAVIEQRHRRPLMQRLKRAALAYLLPEARRVRRLSPVIRLGWRLRALLPARVHALLQSLVLRLRDHPPAPLPAPADPAGSVAFLPGCVQQVLGAHINRATLNLLHRSGYRVTVLSKQSCCGAVEHHLGQRGAALARIRDNIRDWSAQRAARPFDAIVINASGCGTMVKDYGFLLRDDSALGADAASVGALARDIVELLRDAPAPRRPDPRIRGLRVACQVPCSMRHGQRITTLPAALLERFGFRIVPLAGDHLCCGAAGTYSVLQPEMAERLGRQKAELVERSGADLVASGNLGCIMQLGRYTHRPVVHTVQLLEWAAGGDAPPGMEDRIDIPG